MILSIQFQHCIIYIEGKYQQPVPLHDPGTGQNANASVFVQNNSSPSSVTKNIAFASLAYISAVLEIKHIENSQ